jgi:hypothetical protein
MNTVASNLRTVVHSALIAVLMSGLLGCSAITSPVANGIPAQLLPDELLAPSKENLRPIPIGWLRAEPLPITLDTGDVLGIYIENVLPKTTQALPVNFPDSTTLPPSTGVPIPVNENGSVSLPLIDAVKVRGLTVEEAQERILNAYTKERRILNPTDAQQRLVLVTIARPRQTRVHVVRDDSPYLRTNIEDPSFRLYGAAPLGPTRGQGTGSDVELPANEANLLSVLTRTGGMPGPTGTNEVLIYRGFKHIGEPAKRGAWSAERPSQDAARDFPEPRTIRIPLRIPVDAEKPFTEDDIRMRNNDVVYIPAITTDVYYTGGLLPAREIPLPRDYDLRAVEAVLRVGGSIANGGRFANNFTGDISSAGLGNPNPSLLTVIRHTPGGGQVNIRVDLNLALRDPRENILIREEDVLLLQETPAEAVARYLSQTFRVGAVVNVFTRGSAAATATGQIP